ncbi:RNase H domain-containing protein [Abeliophyllum distichum]|uniref:RNase H domain-containing protein n=1 Tax=Abeliophyllum distichum TaxID=126358 RepID=A0ABD1PRV1_9LAMI
MIADIVQLNDIQQKEGKTIKSYFKRFSNVINKIETVTDEKALDALVTGLHMRTPFRRDVQNNQLKTYSQLVDLVQREIRSEETIKNREKAERERGDRYRREGRRSPESRFSRFKKRYSPGPWNNHYRRFNQIEVISAPLPKAPAMAPLPTATPPKFCRIHRTRVHNMEDCLNVRELINYGARSQGEENQPVQGRRWPPALGRRPPPRRQDNGPRRNGGRNDRNQDPPRLNGPAEAPLIWIINTIIGRPSVGGHTMNSRRNYAKAAREEPVESWQVHGHRPEAPLISFTKEDEEIHEISDSGHSLRLPRSPRKARVEGSSRRSHLTSIHHLAMKFPTPGGVATVCGNQMEARACYMYALRKVAKHEDIVPTVMAIHSEPMDLDHGEPDEEMILDEGLDP